MLKKRNLLKLFIASLFCFVILGANIFGFGMNTASAETIDLESTTTGEIGDGFWSYQEDNKKLILANINLDECLDLSSREISLSARSHPTVTPCVEVALSESVIETSLTSTEYRTL